MAIAKGMQRSSASSVKPVVSISHPVTAAARLLEAIVWKFPMKREDVIFIWVTLRSSIPSIGYATVFSVSEFILLTEVCPRFR